MWQCPNCKREFKNIEQDHYCGEEPKTIADYIGLQSEEVRPVLIKVYETMRAAAPEAIEKISWRMPTFWQGENLIHFAAFKKHLGIYPGEITEIPFPERLSGYRTTKGAIQFPLDKEIDFELIADITKWRVSCAEERKAEKSKRKG